MADYRAVVKNLAGEEATKREKCSGRIKKQDVRT